MTALLRLADHVSSEALTLALAIEKGDVKWVCPKSAAAGELYRLGLVKLSDHSNAPRCDCGENSKFIRSTGRIQITVTFEPKEKTT